MKHLSIKLSWLLIGVFGLSECITPFTPSGISTLGGTLVVDGDIILNDQTEIILSYSWPLDDYQDDAYIINAMVWVEDEQGGKYDGIIDALSKTPPRYVVQTNGLDPTLHYKLCILLSDGRRYESPMLQALIAPPIDSIGFEVNAEKTSVEFYVNTLGNLSDSRFYKWRYKEDWEFTSAYQPEYYYSSRTRTIERYLADPYLYYCWSQSESTAILIGKTDHLDNNVVYQKKLNLITQRDSRINYLYSMELTQMSISKEAYTFWSVLEKNTNQMGGIFAPQPSEMAGNIRCVSNPEEHVLGYISVGLPSKKRVFVSARDINIYQSSCVEIDPRNFEPMLDAFDLFDSGCLITQVIDQQSRLALWASDFCVDCRLRGTKNRPLFWPNDHQ